jgi:hypothetical protein
MFLGQSIYVLGPKQEAFAGQYLFGMALFFGHVSTLLGFCRNDRETGFQYSPALLYHEASIQSHSMVTLPHLPQDVKMAAYPFLADSIELAHQCAPARWGLNPRASEGLIRLNVVMTEVLTIGPEIVRVFVNENVAREIPAVKSGTLMMQGRDGAIGDYYPSSPGSRLIEVPRGPQQHDLLSQLFAAHGENIRITAKRGGLGKGVRSAHSDDAVKEIGSWLGRKIPLLNTSL